MFFCEPCRAARQWPESLSYSRGTCECCGVYAYCYNVASSRLPEPRRPILTEAEVIAGFQLF